VLAVDQDLVAFLPALSDEANAALQVPMACGLQVRSRQVQQFDAGGAKLRLVITIFRPQVDDGANAMSFPKLIRALDREAAPDGHSVGEPVKVRCPVVTHASIFFFNSSVFFFIIKVARGTYC
jgi:hypothetical protein